MNSKALVSTRIDREIKIEATAVLAEIGLTVSDVMSMVLTKIAKEKTLPIEFWQANYRSSAEINEVRGHKLRTKTLEEIKSNMSAMLDTE
ncbi:DNA-damage-inducible protein J [Acinetobacter calcoaceticus]|uniref:DNA-damage-inducible protein J n=1 Tax=Acinetobacter calcoaceticus TaxID=471 RepID=A0A4R1XN05_ACICA|nr:DNA-damage-inducible protein J [Acinetobacter calcoaceticus]